MGLSVSLSLLMNNRIGLGNDIDLKSLFKIALSDAEDSQSATCTTITVTESVMNGECMDIWVESSCTGSGPGCHVLDTHWVYCPNGEHCYLEIDNMTYC